MPFYTVLKCIMQPDGSRREPDAQGDPASTQLFSPKFLPIGEVHASSDREALALAKLHTLVPVLEVIRAAGGVQ